jgi:hypothetical protein
MALQPQEMIQLINNIAPVLQPKIIPRGYDDNGLQNIFKSPSEREQLNQIIADYSKRQKGCKYCGVKDIVFRFNTCWEIDFTNSIYQLKNLEVFHFIQSSNSN